MAGHFAWLEPYLPLTSSMSKRTLHSTSLVLLAASCLWAQSEDRGIADFLKAWSDAWDKPDVEALMLLHADDCVTVNRYGALLIGKERTRTALARILRPEILQSARKAIPRYHQTPMELKHVRFIGPDLAVVQAASRVPEILPDTRVWKMRDMIISFVLTNHQGRWIARQIDLHNVDEIFLQPPPKKTRPTLSVVTRPACSKTPTCFCMPVRVM